MFNKENRYITKGISKNLDLRLQLIIWNMIDHLKKETKGIDYLQVFKIEKFNKRIIIEHSQEIPEYKEKYVLHPFNIEINEIIEIFVIDDYEYSTMMLAEEY